MSSQTTRRAAAAIGAAIAVVFVIVIVAAATRASDDEGTAAGPTTTRAPGATPATATTLPDDASDGAGTSGDTGDAGGTGDTAGDTTGQATATPGATDPLAADATVSPAGTDPAPATAPSPASLVTVPTDTVPVADPIPPDEVADFGTGVTASIVRIEAVDGVAQVPGEISGPALRVTVRLDNRSDAALDLARTLVDVTYGPDRTPGLALGQPGGAPFTGQLASGSTADGVYVFGIPVEARDQVQVSVMYDVTAPIVVFEGPAPAR